MNPAYKATQSQHLQLQNQELQSENEQYRDRIKNLEMKLKKRQGDNAVTLKNKFFSRVCSKMLFVPCYRVVK